jgi:hypothetical protein
MARARVRVRVRLSVRVRARARVRGRGMLLGDAGGGEPPGSSGRASKDLEPGTWLPRLPVRLCPWPPPPPPPSEMERRKPPEEADPLALAPPPPPPKPQLPPLPPPPPPPSPSVLPLSERAEANELVRPSTKPVRAPRWLRCGKADGSCIHGGFPLTAAPRPPLHEPLSGPCSAVCGGRKTYLQVSGPGWEEESVQGMGGAGGQG